jgi:hypothetical protein
VSHLSNAYQIELALGVLGLHRESFDLLTPSQLHAHWRELMKRAHPDLPQNRGNGIDSSEINAAYDILKRLNAERYQFFATEADGTVKMKRGDPRDSIAPPWQPDKKAANNKIYVESYRDVNFIKKQLWELSGKSEEVYTIDAFGPDSHFSRDPLYSFQGRTNVYGSPTVFDEMAKAMLIWNANGGRVETTRAVFVSPQIRPNPIYLIYADGRSHSKNPIPMKYDSDAGSHYKDQLFQSNLPRVLDGLNRIFASKTDA